MKLCQLEFIQTKKKIEVQKVIFEEFIFLPFFDFARDCNISLLFFVVTLGSGSLLWLFILYTKIYFS